MSRNILIRADGGNQVGLGHWSRCLFIASCLEKNALISLFTFQAAEFERTFHASDIRLVQINSEDEFFSHVNAGDIVVLDGYKFESSYVDVLADIGALVIYIDDLMKAGIRCDVLINHTPGIHAQNYTKGAAYTTYLLGPRYSMISEVFTASETPVGKRLNRVLVAMGGADPGNITLAVLNKYPDFFNSFECVDIIVGSMYSHSHLLENFCKKNPTFVVHRNLARTEVGEMMKSDGIAVLSSSTMAIEYGHVTGLLYITQTAGNQEFLYRALIESEVALSLTSCSTNMKVKEAHYRKLVERQREMFDGKARNRYKKLFGELVIQQQLFLREAINDDAELTYQWACDQTIRAYSFSKDKITREGHYKWFREKISSGNCVYYIAFLNASPLGSVRFDVNSGDAVISYLLDSAFHGKGIGRPLLAEGIKKLTKAMPDIHTITGYVMDANVASVKVFEKLGFMIDKGYTNSIKFYKTIQ